MKTICRIILIVFFSMFSFGLFANELSVLFVHNSVHNTGDGINVAYDFDSVGVSAGIGYDVNHIWDVTMGIKYAFKYIYPFVNYSIYYTKYGKGSYELHSLIAGVGSKANIDDDVYIFIEAGAMKNIYHEFKLGGYSFNETFPKQTPALNLVFGFGFGYVINWM